MSDDFEKNPVTGRTLNTQSNRLSKLTATKRTKPLLPSDIQAADMPSLQERQNESNSRVTGQSNRLETLQASSVGFAQRINPELHGGTKASRESFTREMRGDRLIEWKNVPSAAVAGLNQARKDLGEGIGGGVAGLRSAVSDVMSGKYPRKKNNPFQEVPEIDAKKASGLARQSVLDTFSDLSGMTAQIKSNDRKDRERLLAKYYDPNNGNAAGDAVAKIDQLKNNINKTVPTNSKIQGGRERLPQQLSELLSNASKMIEDQPKDRFISWGNLTGANSVKSGIKSLMGAGTPASSNRGQVDKAIQQSTPQNTKRRSSKGNDQE